MGQQEEGPREETSKSQHRPSHAPQLFIHLCPIFSLQQFQLFTQQLLYIICAGLLPSRPPFYHYLYHYLNYFLVFDLIREFMRHAVSRTTQEGWA